MSVTRQENSFHLLRQLLFVVICLIVIVLPAVKIDFSQNSEKENRRLAAFPEGFHFSSAYFQQWEKAFNDRFFGRNAMIDLSGRITLHLEPLTSKAVLEGVDHWLFFREALPPDIPYGKKKNLAPQQMKKLGENLDLFHQYAKKHHKKFVFVICPDKVCVYGDLTGIYTKESLFRENDTGRFVGYLRNHYDFPVIYEKTELLQQREKHPFDLYYKYDTHWNAAGAYYGYYLPVMKALELSPDKVQKWELRDAGNTDLIKMLSPSLSINDFPKQKAPRAIFASKGPRNSLVDDPHSTPTCRTSCSKNRRGNGCRLFCLRDSFSSAAIPYFARSFSQTRYLWRLNYDIFETDRPFLEASDVIIIEVVERLLPHLADVLNAPEFK